MRTRLSRPILLAAAMVVAGAALAQDQAAPPPERSRFVRFIEGLLSTEDRQVTIEGLAGTFSSTPHIERLTVADREGVWLEIGDLDLSWTRTALFRRVLDIQNFEAGTVHVLRKPVSPAAPAAEEPEEGGGSFSLPVDVRIDRFALPDIVLDEPLAGIGANLSAEGSAEIDDETIATQIGIERLDEPGGSLSADLRLQPGQNVLAADLRLAEPQGGLISDLLGIPGRPAIEVTLDGSGPLGDWTGRLGAHAGGTEIVSGTIGIAEADGGYRFTGDLAGMLAPVVPQAYAAFVAGRSTLAFDVTRSAEGALGIERAQLASEGAAIEASGTIGADLVPRSGAINARIGQAGRTALPFVPGDVALDSLVLDARLDEGATAPWRAELTASGITSEEGDLGEVRLTASGEATDLGSAEDRATTFTVTGRATAIAAADEALRRALGDEAELDAAGRWTAGEAATFQRLDVALGDAEARFSGMVAADRIDGQYSVSAADLSRFAALAGRPLQGRAAANLNGRIVPAEAGFELMVNAVAVDLGLGVGSLDPLLAGESHVVGGIARDGGAIRFEDLRLETPEANALVNGTFAEPEIDLRLEAQIADLGAATDRAEGRLAIEASLSGSADAPRVEAEASGDDLVLMGRPFTGASASFSGIVAGPETDGTASLAGSLGGVPVEGRAELAAGEGGARVLRDLLVSVGESRLSGDLTIGAGNLLDGEIAIVSPNLSVVAPLLLVEAGGSLQAGLTLTSEGGRQNARFAGTADNLVYETIRVGAAELNGTASDLFSAPQIDGAVAIRNLVAGGLTIVRADGRARRTGAATSVNVDADLADGSASLAGSLAPRGDAFAVALDRLTFRQPGANLALAAPATVLIEDGTASVGRTTIDVNGGSIVVGGRAGSELALDVALNQVPAALINSFAPDLDAEGTISGTAKVTGPSSDPRATYDLGWQGASLAATRNAGLGALGITANGSYRGGALGVTSRINGADGLAVTVGGNVRTAGGATLDLRVGGTVPLSLGNVQLADRGAALSGALNLDIAVTGPAASPNYAGTIRAEGGGLVDPETGIVLRDLSLAASLSGKNIVLDRLSARSGDGTVTASGTIGLDPAAGLPVDLAIVVRGARYVDGSLVAATFNADLAITGGLASGPTIAGTVDISRAEITVPESLPQGSIAVQVMHLHEPPDVAETVARAEYGQSGGGDAAGGESSGASLDIRLRAPSAIFVRGRGLDAELGGELSLRGPVSNIVAAGAFEMRRGRFDILTQRITFDRGIATFAGDLDPVLDFSGTTQSGDVTITVTVTGQASDPEVHFSSVPELPEDEVLAYLLFNRSVSDLSPFQLARLAAAVAQFAGGSSGGGILDQMRQATGLDDLDVVTDETGGTAVQAGRYINENLYLGVQQGIDASTTRVTIDLQITDQVKARGAVSPDGGSSLGVFYEREY